MSAKLTVNSSIFLLIFVLRLGLSLKVVQLSAEYNSPSNEGIFMDDRRTKKVVRSTMKAHRLDARPRNGPPGPMARPSPARPNSHSLLGWAGLMNIARRARRAEIFAGPPGPN